MGNAGPHSYPDDGEGPVRRVRLDPFWIDACAVSNADFATFVEETEHVTEAERFGWSFVFAGLLPDDFPPTRGVAHAPWWRQAEGADWRRPKGPQSDLEGRVGPSSGPRQLQRCPGLLHLGRQATADRSGVGVRRTRRARGEAIPLGRRARARRRAPHERLAGPFPGENTGADGFYGTCPVDEFPPNGFGLHNMTGNVWEWCADWFHSELYAQAVPTARRAAAPTSATTRTASATGWRHATR